LAKNKGYSGYITKDAIVLEQQLSDRLSNLTPGSTDSNSRKMMQAFGHTFDEVIKRDRDFGGLLLKIKHAYDDYLTKVTNEEPIARPPSLASRLQQVAQKDPDAEANKKIEAMRSQLEKMDRQAANQSAELNRLRHLLAEKEGESLALHSKVM
jgi:hypothetical protein